MNLYIKDVAKLAIPNSVVILYEDGERVDHEGTVVPKWQVISSHTARRTAVSLLRSLSIPDHQIQRMTGHTNVAELHTYDMREAETMDIQLHGELDKAWAKSRLRAV